MVVSLQTVGVGLVAAMLVTPAATAYLVTRRLVTMIPSMIVIFIGLDPTQTLVFSQVILSFGLPFTVIPLLLFTSSRKLMGEMVNKKITSVILGIIAAIIVALNLYLIFITIRGG